MAAQECAYVPVFDDVIAGHEPLAYPSMTDCRYHRYVIYPTSLGRFF